MDNDDDNLPPAVLRGHYELSRMQSVNTAVLFDDVTLFNHADLFRSAAFPSERLVVPEAPSLSHFRKRGARSCADP